MSPTKLPLLCVFNIKDKKPPPPEWMFSRSEWKRSQHTFAIMRTTAVAFSNYRFSKNRLATRYRSKCKRADPTLTPQKISDEGNSRRVGFFLPWHCHNVSVSMLISLMKTCDPIRACHATETGKHSRARYSPINPLRFISPNEPSRNDLAFRE